jgi:hypothetical protein
MHREARGLDANAAQAARYAKDFGVQSHVLNNQALRREEPCLKKDLRAPCIGKKAGVALIRAGSSRRMQRFFAVAVATCWKKKCSH